MNKKIKSVIAGLAISLYSFQPQVQAQNKEHQAEFQHTKQPESYNFFYQAEEENFSRFMQEKLEKEFKVNPRFHISPESAQDVEKKEKKLMRYISSSAGKELEATLKDLPIYELYKARIEEPMEDFLKTIIGRKVKLDIMLTEDESFDLGNSLFEKNKYDSKFKAFPPSWSLKIGSITKLKVEHDIIRLGVERKLGDRLIASTGIKRGYDDDLRMYYGLRTGKTRFGEVIIGGEIAEGNEQRFVGMLTLHF